MNSMISIHTQYTSTLKILIYSYITPLLEMTSPEKIKITVSPLSDSSNKLINSTKTHVKTVTEMASNPNLQNENVKKEVSKVQSQAESLLNQVDSTLIAYRSEVNELRKTVTSHEKKIESHEKKIKSHEKKIKSQEKKIESKEKKIENHEKKIKSHEKKIESQEKKIESKEKKIESQEEKIGILQETLLAPILLRSLRDEQLVKLFNKLKQASQQTHWPAVIENTRQFRRGRFSCCVGHLKAYVNQLLKNSK